MLIKQWIIQNVDTRERIVIHIEQPHRIEFFVRWTDAINHLRIKRVCIFIDSVGSTLFAAPLMNDYLKTVFVTS